MANQEQLEILRQGVDVWNKWREENPTAKINLRGANLFDVNLRGANLSEADLWEANLICADLTKTDLRETKLILANLGNAILKGASLKDANLRFAYLVEANLSEADLMGADLKEVDLTGANLKGAIMGRTTLGKIIFTKTIGLEEVNHKWPSTIGTDTLQRFKGNLPEKFLRGCGLSDWEIESAKLYNPDLSNDEIVKIQYRMFDLRATQAIQINPLFISYSHADTEFVNHIDQTLTKKGIRFWRDIHDAKAGRLETQIDRAIRQNPTVLLILSKNSIKSDWVEHEVRKARELEKELGRDALCPVALDDAWKSSPWPERVMEQIMEYNILDFSGWQDQPTFESKFAKLLSGLDLFYKKPEA